MQNLFNNQEMRKHVRRPFSQPVSYSISALDAKERKWLNLKGNIFDISERGVGIFTDYPLEPGHILWFHEVIEDKAGFVRWCAKYDHTYRAGIELDGTQVKILDEETEFFNNRLEEIERRCFAPDANPEELLSATRKAIDTVLAVCQEFEQEVQDKEIIRDARIRFREKTNHILSKSYFINRARTWPQGYQGDYKMLENIYRNTPLSDGIGYYLDMCSLNTPLGIAVRNRIKKLEDILREELVNRYKPSVLDIACGSCREVFELASEIERSDARFICVDLDDDALAFAANRLSYTGISPLTSDHIKLRKYNALRMFDNELNMSEFGKQDIIYSVGFFDYLPSDFLTNMLGSLYRLLKANGILIAAFKDAHRYRALDYHWIVDWDGFLQRTEEDFWKIFDGAKIPHDHIIETREETGIIIFYLIRKLD
ncbi:MAG: methyltransferase [Nitrospirota bacterium]